MKVFNLIWKIVVAVAAVAGIVYVVINYGDKISAWFKKHFGCYCCCDCDCDCECDCDCDCDCEEDAAEDADFEN